MESAHRGAERWFTLTGAEMQNRAKGCAIVNAIDPGS
jgi:hypothetical protein